MKILLLSFHKIINSSGGAEKVFCEMASHFVSKGHVVKAICYNDEQGTPFYKIDDRVDFVNAGCNAKKERPLLYKIRRLITLNKVSRHTYDDIIDNKIRKKRIGHLICAFNPDIVISYSIESTQFLTQVLKVKSRIITMLHTNPNEAFKNIEKSFFKNFVEKQSCIQVLTPRYVKLCKELFQLNNVVYIPNFVSQYEYIDYNKRKNIIINVARFDEYKRQHMLIEAFSRIAIDFPDWKLEFWGDKNYDNRYYKYCFDLAKKLKILDKINFCGTSNDIYKQLKRSKIFAFPSAFEGFGLALAEAMSSGTVPIAFKSCSGTNEMIFSGENGVLCDDGIISFAEGLRDLMINEKLCECLGKKAHKDMERYSSENVWRQWDLLIESVISR